jgi:hypothetical protein
MQRTVHGTSVIGMCTLVVAAQAQPRAAFPDVPVEASATAPTPAKPTPTPPPVASATARAMPPAAAPKPSAAPEPKPARSPAKRGEEALPRFELEVAGGVAFPQAGPFQAFNGTDRWGRQGETVSTGASLGVSARYRVAPFVALGAMAEGRWFDYEVMPSPDGDVPGARGRFSSAYLALVARIYPIRVGVVSAFVQLAFGYPKGRWGDGDFPSCRQITPWQAGLALGSDFSMTRWLRLGVWVEEHPVGGLWECTDDEAPHPPAVVYPYALGVSGTVAID